MTVRVMTFEFVFSGGACDEFTRYHHTPTRYRMSGRRCVGLQRKSRKANVDYLLVHVYYESFLQPHLEGRVDDERPRPILYAQDGTME